MPYAARIDLWLGAAFSPAQIRELRHLNPDIRVLTSINAVEHPALPEDYPNFHTQWGDRALPAACRVVRMP
jgi:AMMECR1 domain-containing protein